jgi:hypothetical protein
MPPKPKKPYKAKGYGNIPKNILMQLNLLKKRKLMLF